jgi:hypothetical protein
MSAALPMTMSVPQFFRLVFDIGERCSYDAAIRGDVPVVRIGGKVRVPVQLALSKIAGNDAAILELVTSDLLQKLSREQAAA